jgi:hypothetical protein
LGLIFFFFFFVIKSLDLILFPLFLRVGFPFLPADYVVEYEISVTILEGDMELPNKRDPTLGVTGAIITNILIAAAHPVRLFSS